MWKYFAFSVFYIVKEKKRFMLLIHKTRFRVSPQPLESDLNKYLQFQHRYNRC